MTTSLRHLFTTVSIVILILISFASPAAGQGDIIPADTLALPEKQVFIDQTCTTDSPVETTFTDFFTTPHQGYLWVQDVERQLGYIQRIFGIADSQGGSWVDLTGAIAEVNALMTTALNADGTIPCEGNNGYAAARWELVDSLAVAQAALGNVRNSFSDPFDQGSAIVGRLMDKLATSHYAALLHVYTVANPNQFGTQRIAASMSAVAAQEPSRAAEPPEPPITYDEFVGALCSQPFTPLFSPDNPSPDQPYALIDSWYNQQFNSASGGQAAARIDAAYNRIYETLAAGDREGFSDFELAISTEGVSSAIGSQLVYGDSVYQTRESRGDAAVFAQRYLDICDDIAAYRWGVVYDMGGFAPEPPQMWFQLLGITPARLALRDFLDSKARSSEVVALADVAFDALDHAEHLAMQGIEMTAAALRGEDVEAFAAAYPAYVSRVVVVVTPDAGTIFQSRASGGIAGLITSDSNVNVRIGAGTGFDIVTSVSPGTSVTVTGRNADSSWLAIEVDGKSGWIASFLISVEGNVSELSISG